MAAHASSELTILSKVFDKSCLKLLASMKSGFKIYCYVCASSVDMKRLSHIKQHIDHKKHHESFASKRPRRPNVEAVPVEEASGKQFKLRLHEAVD